MHAERGTGLAATGGCGGGCCCFAASASLLTALGGGAAAAAVVAAARTRFLGFWDNGGGMCCRCEVADFLASSKASKPSAGAGPSMKGLPLNGASAVRSAETSGQLFAAKTGLTACFGAAAATAAAAAASELLVASREGGGTTTPRLRPWGLFWMTCFLFFMASRSRSRSSVLLLPLSSSVSCGGGAFLVCTGCCTPEPPTPFKAPALPSSCGSSNPPAVAACCRSCCS
mmetsp:Transcript_47733/g.113425  ORF Transcript_47733/g.113425 Transcript_47733/m.113425 type:complete len:229 (+) Transcript_47733:1007-1693(+)